MCRNKKSIISFTLRDMSQQMCTLIHTLSLPPSSLLQRVPARRIKTSYICPIRIDSPWSKGPPCLSLLICSAVCAKRERSRAAEKFRGMTELQEKLNYRVISQSDLRKSWFLIRSGSSFNRKRESDLCH